MMAEIEQDYIFFCDKRKQCTWKCFALSHEGFAIGKIDQNLSAWREAHAKRCGGELKQGVIVVLAPKDKE